MAQAYVSLGSNLGDRSGNLKKAIHYLESIGPISILKKSSILDTEPVDFLPQPRFLNQIMVIETTLLPLDLLHILKQAEIDLGRKKTIPKGPRAIDLDILLYDDLIMNTEELIIPHPQIKNRKFILQHLVELDPELFDPVSGKKYRDLS
jgi:2-amino-4-hydroxy-6-hydroxymethyldihydropteridine diphosphokinase